MWSLPKCRGEAKVSQLEYTMNEATFGFSATDIDQLAAELARALGVRLYAQRSPMIGSWYSSQDLNAAIKTLKEKGPEAAVAAFKVEQSVYELVPNNPEPGYTAPEFPGGGDYLLRVRAETAELQQIEQKLRDSTLPFKRLK